MEIHDANALRVADDCLHELQRADAVSAPAAAPAGGGDLLEVFPAGGFGGSGGEDDGLVQCRVCDGRVSADACHQVGRLLICEDCAAELWALLRGAGRRDELLAMARG